MFASKDTLLTRPSGYTIARSVRLRSSASGYFNRTPASASNRKTWTWSGWVKRGLSVQYGGLFTAWSSNNASDYAVIRFDDDQLVYKDWVTVYRQTSQVFRDFSAWYHIVVAIDTTQATAANRVKMYVNGVQVTAFATSNDITQNSDTNVNNTVIHTVGVNYFSSAPQYFTDGYLTEINFIDGQALTPSSFGTTNAITGVWQPIKYTGTYGTNGFYLNFSDNSNNTAATIGKDYSGNGNNWTPNNISVTAGVTYDSMTDVPTLTSATAANYAVFNPLASAGTFSNANLNLAIGSTAESSGLATIALPSTGKYYWEVTVTAVGSDYLIGIYNGQSTTSPVTDGTFYLYRYTGAKQQSGSTTAYGSSYTTNDIIGVAVDMDAGTITFYKNNTSQGQAFSGISGGNFRPTSYLYNNASAAINFGQRPFSYTPPTGFVALNTYNLPASTITNGAAYMAATLYTGNLTGQSITNGGNNTLGTTFQPDLVWIKSRSAATDNKLTDSVRGATKALISNTTGAETTDLTGVTAINNNGFTLGVSTVYNNTSVTYVGWQWQAGASAGSSNTNGSITSTVSAGATQGFSVVTYTGSGSAATVGHGLGVAPSFVIVKFRTEVENWYCYHASIGNTKAILLNTTGAATSASANYWNNTTPTSSVVSLGGTTSAPYTYVMYAFAAVAGYSAFGSYIGNGTQGAGPFVFLGFRPRYVLVKNASVGGRDWHDYDSSRSPFNYSGSNILKPNTADAELTGRNDVQIDMLSNGFRLIGNDAGINESGATFIYMCFAENPFKNSLAR